MQDPNSILNPALWCLRDAFRAQGFDLKLVGGCVRDLMLGLTPKDVDLHTDATPDECVLIYQAEGVRFEETGLSHGTISVIFDHVAYEITSLRTDTETDGRHAVVSYTRDWHTDLRRRDFRFNAMSMSFEGDILDPFGGQADLEAGVVRFVGDAETRIKEDYLRILRWFRFRGRFGMQMDAAAEHAKTFMTWVWTNTWTCIMLLNAPAFVQTMFLWQFRNKHAILSPCWLRCVTTMLNKFLKYGKQVQQRSNWQSFCTAICTMILSVLWL